jgi:hypothetical protein
LAESIRVRIGLKLLNTAKALVELVERTMSSRSPKTIRKGWSYKEDRRLSELAGSGKTLEQIAKAMDRTLDGIRNRSIRLGLSLKPKAPTKKIRG